MYLWGGKDVLILLSGKYSYIVLGEALFRCTSRKAIAGEWTPQQPLWTAAQLEWY